MRLLVMVAAVVGLALAVAGLAGFESPPPPVPEASQEAFEKHTESPGGDALRYAVLDDCITLNPQGTSSLTDFRVINGVFEGLLRVEATDLSLKPGVAVGLPEMSEDGRTLTFTLRDDARWNNGDPVTADEFAFAWRRAITFDFAAVYSGLFFVIEGAEEAYRWREAQLEDFDPDEQTAEQAWAAFQQHLDDTVGIEVLGPKTLRVTLKNPTAYFPSLTAFGTLMPNHRATVEPLITLDAKTGRAIFDGTYFTEPDRLISNGPYRLTLWELRRRLVLDVNPHYWNVGRLSTPRIVQGVIEGNDPLRFVQYLNGKFDWVPAIGGDLAVRLLASGATDTVGVPRAGLEYYAFNVRDEVDGQPNPLADVRVRRALAMAVDKQSLVENVTRLGEPVAHTFVPVGAVPGYDPPVEADPGYDPEAARALLAEAGYPNGQGFPTLRLLYNTSVSREKIAVRVANQWQENLGIPVAAENYEWRTYLDRRRKGLFHVSRSGWYGDYQDPTTWLDLMRGSDPNNATGYIDEKYDAMLRDASAELDADARFDLIRRAEAKLLTDHVIVPLYQVVSVDLVAEHVRDLHQNAWNNMNLGSAFVVPMESR
ncbi:MAG: peptide ABC transporter substrate-binding protein [Planctomycetota bacterium]